MVGTARSADAQTTPSAEAVAAGREHFLRGRAFYDAHRYSDAIDEFRQSLEANPSPNTRLLVARSLRDMGGHTAEAYGEFVTTALDAEERAPGEPRYAPVGAAARAEAGQLVSRIVVLRIRVADPTADTEVQLDGHPVDRSRWNADLPLEPGSHTLDATATGRDPFHRVWEVPAGNAVEIAVTLAITPTQTAPIEAPGAVRTGFVPVQPTYVPPPPVPVRVQAYVPRTRSPLTTLGGTTIAIGAVLLVGGAVGALESLSTYNSLLMDCGDGRCPSSVSNVQSRVEFGRTIGTLGTIGLVSGGALILLGAVMYGVGREQNRRPPDVFGRIYLDPMSGMAGVRGTF